MRADLHGNALVSEARRLDQVTLDDAYHLVELFAIANAHPGNDAPDGSSRLTLQALGALERSVEGIARNSAAETDASSAPRAKSVDAVSSVLPPGHVPRQLPTSPPPLTRPPMAPPSSHRRLFYSAGFILFAVVALLLGGAVAWYRYSTQRDASASLRAPSTDYTEGVAAYKRGAREVARIAFAKAAQASPNDPEPLIFLGRLAREDGNVASARRFLDAAVRAAPSNAVANREFAAVQLSEGNAELARRFYVRAVELDPTDKLAQGFLACALAKLGRAEEAQRWSDRAGSGDWSACVRAPTPIDSISTSAPVRR